MQRYNSIKIKLMIVGNRNGKTSLRERLYENNFTDHTPTNSIEVCSKNYKIESDQVNLQVWDTYSQKYPFIDTIRHYYAGVNAVIVTFDITDEKAFKKAKKIWIDDIRQRSTTPIYLVGTKADLIDERKISETQAKQFAQDNGLIYFGDTSAKTGEGVEELFEKIIAALYQEEKKLRKNAVVPTSTQTQIYLKNSYTDTHWQKYRGLYVGALVGLGITLLAASSYFLLPLIGLAAVVTPVVGTLGLGGSIAIALGFAGLMGLISGIIDRSFYSKESAESSFRLSSSANIGKTLGASMDKREDKQETVIINLTPSQENNNNKDTATCNNEDRPVAMTFKSAI